MLNSRTRLASDLGRLAVRRHLRHMSHMTSASEHHDPPNLETEPRTLFEHQPPVHPTDETAASGLFPVLGRPADGL